jgi:hypothetical protein
MPQEIYRINNNVQIANRRHVVVTVGPEIGWRVSLEPSAASMSPEGGPMTVKVKLDRRGIESDLPFAILGLPEGIQGPRAILFRRGQSELSITLTPTPTGIFAPRPPGQRPPGQFLLAVVNGREGESMMMCSPAVAIGLVMPGAGPPP